ncbi:MAG: hypothetical protein ACPGN3_02875 [Opitutales bacterium]
MLIQDDTQLRLAFVLDDSVSMRAYKGEVSEAVSELLDSVPRSMSLDLGLFTSARTSANLGYYASSQEVRKALEESWNPSSGIHDSRGQIEAASRWAGEQGYVIWISDHTGTQSGANLNISVGLPKENVGITGIDYFEDGRWEARISNFTDSSQSREWWVAYEGGSTEPMELSLLPGQSLRVSGLSFEGLKRPYLKLSADALDIDDVAPLLRPKTEPVSLYVDLVEENREVWDKLAVGLRDWTQLAPMESAHLTVTDKAENVSGRAIRFLSPEAEVLSEEWSRGPFLRGEYALSDGLSFGGLLARFGSVDTPPGSRAYFRLGADPIVWQPPGPRGQLNLQWAPAYSNMDQHPGALLVLDRFLREAQVESGLVRSENYYYGESLKAGQSRAPALMRVWRPGEPQAIDRKMERILLRQAPREVCFFQLLGNDEEILHEGTSHFWEISELDLRDRNSEAFTIPDWTENIRNDLRPPPGIELIPALILAALLGSWWTTHRGEKPNLSQNI